MNVSVDLLINGVNIVLLLVIVMYMMIKDKDTERKIKNIELAIDEILKEGHKNSKIIDGLMKSSNPLEQDKIKSQIETSLKEELKSSVALEVKNDLKDYVKKEMDNAIAPLLSNLSNIEEDIKDFQFDQQDRMATLEQKNRQAEKISIMSQNEEEQQILDMHSKGYSVEQISKELKIASGRVEFIIKLRARN